MNELFRAVSERLKVIFTAHAALDIEAEMIAQHVERKAALLRQAAQLEKEGFADLAAELRQAAGRMDPRRPAESVLPALDAPASPEANGVALSLPTPATERDGTETKLETSRRKKSS
jgi:hypothetical protein